MEKDINSPNFNDNRDYDYSEFSDEHRAEYDLIIGLIEPNSKVIDLGCGNGSLINLLMKQKNCEVTGIELSASGVLAAKNKGLNVTEGRIDSPLLFKDNEFDFAICNVTIQMTMYPEVLFNEMKRIAKSIIISFPNFAFYKNRLQLLVKGTMPQCMLFGYEWYSTGHIHQLSIKDFTCFVSKYKDVKIEKMEFIKTNKWIKDLLIKTFPNLFLILPVFYLRKN